MILTLHLPEAKFFRAYPGVEKDLTKLRRSDVRDRAGSFVEVDWDNHVDTRSITLLHSCFLSFCILHSNRQHPIDT